MSKRKLRALMLASVSAMALSAGSAPSASAGVYQFCGSLQGGNYTCWDSTARSVSQITATSTNTADTICGKLWNSYYGWLTGPQSNGTEGEACATGGRSESYWNNWTGQAVARVYAAAGTRYISGLVYYI